jgi:CRP/FNR family transcriptional regulator, cyclic AMP receptor protein
LKAKIMSITAEKLHEVDLFADVPMEVLEALVAKMQPQTYTAGTLLFSAGDAGDTMYFISSGRVHIFTRDANGEKISITHYGANQVFGELSPIDQRTRSAYAEAADDLSVLSLGREAFLEALHAYPQIGMSMIRSLSWRVRNTTEVLQRQKAINAPAPKAAPSPGKPQEAIGEEYGVFAKMAQSLKEAEAKDEEKKG